MPLHDLTADILTRIRNAVSNRARQVMVLDNKLNRGVAKVLHEEGYIASWSEEAAEPQPLLVIELKYGRNRERVIYGLKRVSKPGRRMYAPKDRLPRVLGGMGTAIMSTSTGVCTAAEAAKRGVGGEVLCFVW